MHEMHLMKDLLADLLKAAEANKIKKITRVTIRMGEFTEINPEILKYFLHQSVKGTPAEKAQVILENSPSRELRLVSFDGE